MQKQKQLQKFGEVVEGQWIEGEGWAVGYEPGYGHFAHYAKHYEEGGAKIGVVQEGIGGFQGFVKVYDGAGKMHLELFEKLAIAVAKQRVEQFV